MWGSFIFLTVLLLLVHRESSECRQVGMCVGIFFFLLKLNSTDNSNKFRILLEKF